MVCVRNANDVGGWNSAYECFGLRRASCFICVKSRCSAFRVVRKEVALHSVSYFELRSEIWSQLRCCSRILNASSSTTEPSRQSSIRKRFTAALKRNGLSAHGRPGENSALRRLDLKRQAGSFKSGHFHPSMLDVKSTRYELVVKYSIPIIELPFAPASTTVMAVPVPAVM
jgi:hypothetical protein